MTYEQNDYKAMLASFEEKRQTLVVQKAALDEELDGLDQVIKGIQKLVHAFSGVGQLTLPIMTVAGRVIVRPYANMTVAEAAKKYLVSVGGDRTIQEIMEALNAGGLEKNYNTIYSGLLRAKDIVRTKKKKYRLVGSGEEVPPVES